MLQIFRKYQIWKEDEEKDGAKEIEEAVLPDLEPFMISPLEGKTLCDVMSLALQRASVLRADQLCLCVTLKPLDHQYSRMERL